MNLGLLNISSLRIYPRRVLQNLYYCSLFRLILLLSGCHCPCTYPENIGLLLFPYSQVQVLLFLSFVVFPLLFLQCGFTLLLLSLLFLNVCRFHLLLCLSVLYIFRLFLHKPFLLMPCRPYLSAAGHS